MVFQIKNKMSIKTKLIQSVTDDNDCLEVISQYVASNSNTVDLAINSVVRRKFVIIDASPSFSEELLDLLGAEMTQIVYVIIDYREAATSPVTENVPKKMSITLNGAYIGYLTRFELVNIQDGLTGTLLIDNLEGITIGKTNELTIIVGLRDEIAG
jgi:hypothetical protein